MDSDEEEDDEDEDDDDSEESSEDDRDFTEECVHRLPIKNQKVNLDFYSDLVRIEKQNKNPKKRGLIRTWLWGEDPADILERTRYIILQEGKIITVKQIPVCQRKYG